MTELTPTVRVAGYPVDMLPEDQHGNDLRWRITVEYRGRDRWAVMHFGEALGTDGRWEYEPSPSSRDDLWLETHRFDLDTALTLAKDAAPKLEVNGETAQQFHDWQTRAHSRL